MARSGSSNGGRMPLQARCVQLARMGCVVFHYDMVGYADSTQISDTSWPTVRQTSGRRWNARELGSSTPAGGTAAAEHHGLADVELHSGARLRLSELPEVDPRADRRDRRERRRHADVAFCARSTTRPRPSFPAVMVSTAMQGGCTCENCSLLRVGTGNIEFAALIGATAAGHDRRRRLDEGDRNQGLAGAARAL